MSAIVGVIIVDHGSRRRESNEMLHEATTRFAAQSEFSIVEPAHMELAEPSIAQAFDRCVARGATEVVVFPYFLSPGRHWTEDIPRLAAAAAEQHPEIPWFVTAPFGLHPGMLAVINDRIQHCRSQSTPQKSSTGCDVCGTAAPCRNTGTGKS
jgi:sirohydrochlorin ferrochelatase